MYVFKNHARPLGFSADEHGTMPTTMTTTPVVNNPTVPTVTQPPFMNMPVMPTGVAPSGYVSIFGRLVSYQQIALGLALLVGGFFLWKRYKTPAKTA